MYITKDWILEPDWCSTMQDNAWRRAMGVGWKPWPRGSRPDGTGGYRYHVPDDRPMDLGIPAAISTYGLGAYGYGEAKGHGEGEIEDDPWLYRPAVGGQEDVAIAMVGLLYGTGG